EYLESKILLFNKLQVNDWAVINIDDPSAYRIIENLTCKYLTYGFSEDADVRPLKYTCTINGIRAGLRTPMGELNLESPLIGRINLSNIMAAVTSGIIKGISFENIAGAVKAFTPIKGRLDFAYRGEFSVLIDYAHTDRALEALLQSLRELTPGRLIVVFGAGGDRDKTKRPRMGAAASRNADFVVVTSDNPRSEEPLEILDDIVKGFEPEFKDYMVEVDREKAIGEALAKARKGDLVAVAGKGHEDYQIFKDGTIHFDDYEVVQKIMEQKETDA
ncbi:MAG: UDP-N-acetylmuramyl-tripeptide synthetase, partial [bacterium]|nr:UDP-N-acetylmuramyl-tripeptide synthetase [bacterium]